MYSKGQHCGSSRSDSLLVGPAHSPSACKVKAVFDKVPSSLRGARGASLLPAWAPLAGQGCHCGGVVVTHC
jgi:hypothetical protein